MLGRKKINKRKAAVLLTGLFAVVAAALFATSFAHSAYDDQGKMVSFKGEVIAIDPAAKTFTAKSIESAEESSPITLKGELTFVMDELTKVKECDKDMAFSDLKVGDHVSVSYHEKEGKSLADNIAIEALGKKC